MIMVWYDIAMLFMIQWCFFDKIEFVKHHSIFCYILQYTFIFGNQVILFLLGLKGRFHSNHLTDLPGGEDDDGEWEMTLLESKLEEPVIFRLWTTKNGQTNMYNLYVCLWGWEKVLHFNFNLWFVGGIATQFSRLRT